MWRKLDPNFLKEVKSGIKRTLDDKELYAIHNFDGEVTIDIYGTEKLKSELAERFATSVTLDYLSLLQSNPLLRFFFKRTIKQLLKTLYELETENPDSEGYNCT